MSEVNRLSKSFVKSIQLQCKDLEYNLSLHRFELFTKSANAIFTKINNKWVYTLDIKQSRSEKTTEQVLAQYHKDLFRIESVIATIKIEERKIKEV